MKIRPNGDAINMWAPEEDRLLQHGLRRGLAPHQIYALLYPRTFDSIAQRVRQTQGYALGWFDTEALAGRQLAQQRIARWHRKLLRKFAFAPLTSPRPSPARGGSRGAQRRDTMPITRANLLAALSEAGTLYLLCSSQWLRLSKVKSGYNYRQHMYPTAAAALDRALTDCGGLARIRGYDTVPF